MPCPLVPLKHIAHGFDIPESYRQVEACKTKGFHWFVDDGGMTEGRSPEDIPP